MNNLKTQTVAQFLTEVIDKNPKTQRQIALEIGYKKPNIITMFKQGLTRLPLDKIGPLAKSLEIDSSLLFSKVLREYTPETFVALSPILQALELSEEELMLISNWRYVKNSRR